MFSMVLSCCRWQEQQALVCGANWVLFLHTDTPVEPGCHQDQGIWGMADVENGVRLLGNPLFSLLWVKPTCFGKYSIGDHTSPGQARNTKSLEMRHQ